MGWFELLQEALQLAYPWNVPSRAPVFEIRLLGFI